MKRSILFGIAALLAGCLTTHAVSAQMNWTAEQKAVWETETTMSDLWVKGDTQDALNYFDDGFVNWGPHSHIPVPKDVFVKNVKYYLSQGFKYDHHTMVPIDIWVNGNYAYTFYYDNWVVENKEGKKTMERGRNLDVFMKKGDKWALVASMTMDDPQDK